ncbi:MAG: hypothetical protein IKI21_12610, partial [Oscillospiraceae bacterium]|nr:hypothetical protein [Oscillospiraceae bacterium]
HKGRQMDKDPARRNDPGKQGYEKKRIEVDLKMLDQLQKLNKTVTANVMKGLTGGVKEIFRQDLEDEKRKRDDMAITAEDHRLSTLRSLYRMCQLEDSYYERRQRPDGSKETLGEVRARVAAGVTEKLTLKLLEGQIGRYGKMKDLSDSCIGFSSPYAARGEKVPESALPELFRKDLRKNDWAAFSLDPDADRVIQHQHKLLADTPDRRYQSATDDRTVLSLHGKTAVLRAEAVYSATPYVRPELVDLNYFKEESLRSLPTLNISGFKPIGIGAVPGKDKVSLSEKDFAAIAYAAGSTPQAHDMIDETMKYPVLDVSMAQNCPHYTSFFGGAWFEDKKLGHGLDPYIGAIAKSREMAYAALQAYHSDPPDKKPLADLLKAGISSTIKIQREGFSGNELESEMLTRMTDMLDRDPELKRMAFSRELEKKYRDYLASMKVFHEIQARAHEARYKLLTRDVPLTDGERIEYITDVYLHTMVTEEVNKAQNVRDNDPAYQNALRSLSTTPRSSRRNSAKQ